MSDVVALGEILIDFTPYGISDKGNPVFERNPGGAPANVLSMLSKLGVDTAFIGKVGDDLFGRGLKNTLAGLRINTDGLILTKQYNTTLAFVELDKSGDRTFGFVRNFGADKMLTPAEVNLSLLDGAKIFHFGGLSLTDEPARTATFETVSEAKKRGIVVTFDPNYREPLWKSPEMAADVMRKGLRLADVVKVSEEECLMLAGIEDLDEASRKLVREYDIKLLFITMGAKGAACRFGGNYIEKPTFNADTIDTTGAGDAFFGGIIYSYIKSGKKVDEINADDINEFLTFANAAGTIVTTRKGALMSMPSLEEINDLINRG